MEINVFEYAIPGHFTLLDSVTRIFSSDPKNEVNLYVTDHHKPGGSKLLDRLGRANISLLSFNESIATNGLKILITPDHQLDTTYQLVADGGPTWLFVHNIDDWFELGWRKTFRQVKDALIKDKNPRLAFYLAKRAIHGNRRRKSITEALRMDSGSCFVVLNKDLKSALSAYVSPDKIKIIPFSIHDPEIKDLSDQNTRVRICIPGILSQKRRDYLGVFKMLETLPTEAIDKIELDLLGGVSKSPAEMSDIVVEAAKTLLNKGFHIVLREKEYVELEEFDHELGKADVILGNLNIDQGGGSLYGKTKESGIPFTMVRAGKPGILPMGYSTLEGLEESTIYFESYNDLKDRLLSLFNTPGKLEYLKKSANLSSKKYIDNKLLNQIYA